MKVIERQPPTDRSVSGYIPIAPALSRYRRLPTLAHLRARDVEIIGPDIELPIPATMRVMSLLAPALSVIAFTRATQSQQLLLTVCVELGMRITQLG